MIRTFLDHERRISDLEQLQLLRDSIVSDVRVFLSRSLSNLDKRRESMAILLSNRSIRSIWKGYQLEPTLDARIKAWRDRIEKAYADHRRSFTQGVNYLSGKVDALEKPGFYGSLLEE